MPYYYYACSYQLTPGSVVIPGNWGRIMRVEAIDQQSHWRLLKEQVWEVVRLRHFPSLPSRFEANFLCETLQDLVSFKTSSVRAFDLGYEVELVNPVALSHRSCMVIFESATQGPIAAIEQRAYAYWSGQNIQKPEILTMSPVRIIAQQPI